MKLYHPTFEGKFREVPDSDVEKWVESGWKKSAPKQAEPKAELKK